MTKRPKLCIERSRPTMQPDQVPGREQVLRRLGWHRHSREAYQCRRMSAFRSRFPGQASLLSRNGLCRSEPRGRCGALSKPESVSRFQTAQHRGTEDQEGKNRAVEGALRVRLVRSRFSPSAEGTQKDRRSSPARCGLACASPSSLNYGMRGARYLRAMPHLARLRNANGVQAGSRGLRWSCTRPDASNQSGREGAARPWRKSHP